MKRLLHRQDELFSVPNSPHRRRSDHSLLVSLLNTMGSAYVLTYLTLGAIFALTLAANAPTGELQLSNRETAALMAFVRINQNGQQKDVKLWAD